MIVSVFVLLLPPDKIKSPDVIQSQQSIDNDFDLLEIYIERILNDNSNDSEINK